MIRNFTYAGTAPDAFLIGGVSGRPNEDPDVVPVFPFSGEHYQFSDRRIKAWGHFDGKRTMLFTLPKHVSVDDLSWLSIWCRDYSVNFGQALLNKN